MTEMVRRGTIRVRQNVPGGPPWVIKAAWWYLPEDLFWVQNCCALALAAAGILLTYRKGRPVMSILGFSVSALAAVLGYLLTVIDESGW
jgi:hypothetical protein